MIYTLQSCKIAQMQWKAQSPHRIKIRYPKKICSKHCLIFHWSTQFPSTHPSPRPSPPAHTHILVTFIGTLLGNILHQKEGVKFKKRKREKHGISWTKNRVSNTGGYEEKSQDYSRALGQSPASSRCRGKDSWEALGRRNATDEPEHTENIMKKALAEMLRLLVTNSNRNKANTENEVIINFRSTGGLHKSKAK